MTAIETVRDTLLACLPPGVPPSFSKIVHARFEGAGKAKKAIANLIMFDGQPAVVECAQWTFGWSHRFTEMPGGDATFENGQWQRVEQDAQQFSMEFAA